MGPGIVGTLINIAGRIFCVLHSASVTHSVAVPLNSRGFDSMPTLAVVVFARQNFNHKKCLRSVGHIPVFCKERSQYPWLSQSLWLQKTGEYIIIVKLYVKLLKMLFQTN